MPIGKIRVGKYDWKKKNEPSTPGYSNILIHTTGELSPYVMKDKNGIIMENWWQFSKVFPKVNEQKQPISRYHPKIIRWKHPKEIHYDNTILTPEYWKWRDKGLHHNLWVRYPNGYSLHGTSIGSVIGTASDYEIVDYVEARKKIYYPKYREIALETNLYKELKAALENGENIQINEVDGPSYDLEYPYSLVKNSSLEMTQEIIDTLINDPKYSFGHGYCLAQILLDVEHKFA